jgi:hypothetical protein
MLHAVLVHRRQPRHPDPPDTSRKPISGHFFRLVRIFLDNEVLLKELARSRDAIEQARCYLASPGTNPALGQARLTQLRLKRHGLLCLLRANRHEVRRILNLP